MDNMATTMSYNSNYGNPWGMNNFGQHQGQNVLQTNNQNSLHVTIIHPK